MHSRRLTNMILLYQGSEDFAPEGRDTVMNCLDGPALSNILIQSGQQSFCQELQLVAPYTIPSSGIIDAKISVH